MVRTMWWFCCLFVLFVLVLIGEIVTQHRAAVIIVFAVVSVVLFYAVVRSAMAYGDERGTGLIKKEEELLEDGEIYEVMGVVRISDRHIFDPYEFVAVLRLRSGELRACWMGSIPSTKVFKARKDKGGSIEVFDYPPESLKGRIIDIQA